MILALTSDKYEVSKMYDAADSILAQKLSQVEGVGQVSVGGGAKPAVRVELNPRLLNGLSIGTDQIRTALGQANAIRPKGALSNEKESWQIDTTDQLHTAEPYRKLIISYRDGAAVRLGDLADVQDSVEDRRNAGYADGKPAVLIILSRQPAANLIDTVDRIRAMLPRL